MQQNINKSLFTINGRQTEKRKTKKMVNKDA